MDLYGYYSDQDFAAGCVGMRLVFRVLSLVFFLIGIISGVATYWLREWKVAEGYNIAVSDTIAFHDLHVGYTSTCVRRWQLHDPTSNNSETVLHHVCVKYSHVDGDAERIDAGWLEDIRTGNWTASPEICGRVNRSDAALSLGIPAEFGIAGVWDTLCGGLLVGAAVVGWIACAFGLFAGFFRLFTCSPTTQVSSFVLGILASLLAMTTILLWTNGVRGSGLRDGKCFWYQLISSIAFGMGALTIPAEVSWMYYQVRKWRQQHEPLHHYPVH